VESVVVPAPRCRNDVLGFYDLELPASPAKLSRGRQPSGRSPDYQSLGNSTHLLKLATAHPDGGGAPDHADMRVMGSWVPTGGGVNDFCHRPGEFKT
jgi:hypothetical protein